MNQVDYLDYRDQKKAQRMLEKAEQYAEGGSTQLKQVCFRDLLLKHMAIVNAILSKQINRSKFGGEYVYIDLNAGIGCSSSGEPGSPCIFLESATAMELAVYAQFWEAHQETCDALRGNLHNYQAPLRITAEITNDFHDKLIDQSDPYAIALQKRKNALGLIYHDPSTPFLSADTLAHLSTAMPNMDILINIASRSRRRTNHFKANLLDEIAPVQKRRWFIRKFEGVHDWTMLYGTNYASQKPFGSKWVDVQSDAGKYLLIRACYTKKEQAEMELPAQAYL